MPDTVANAELLNLALPRDGGPPGPPLTPPALPLACASPPWVVCLPPSRKWALSWPAPPVRTFESSIGHTDARYRALRPLPSTSPPSPPSALPEEDDSFVWTLVSCLEGLIHELFLRAGHSLRTPVPWDEAARSAAPAPHLPHQLLSDQRLESHVGDRWPAITAHVDIQGLREALNRRVEQDPRMQWPSRAQGVRHCLDGDGFWRRRGREGAYAQTREKG